MDLAGDLGPRDLASAVVEELLPRQDSTTLQLHEGDRHLIESGVRAPDDGCHAHAGGSAEKRLDLDRRDVLATYLEHVLQTSVEDQAAVRRAAVQITGVQPAVCVEGRARLLRV